MFVRMWFVGGKGGKQMTEQQLQRRREELRRNREDRKMMIQRRKRRNRRRAMFCLFVLALTVFLVVGFCHFVEHIVAPKPVAVITDEPIETPLSTGENNLSGNEGYVKENNNRYEAYQSSTGLSDDETIWQVNARLDLELFDAVTHSEDKLNNDILVVVNKYHKVPDDYEPMDLTSNSDGCQLRAATADAFDRMKEAAANEGLSLRAISGYRSVEYQRELYEGYLQSDSRENVDTYSARAGYSEHHTGMAVDVFGSVDGLGEFENTPEYQWVKQHGHEYGFIIRYTAPEETVTGYMDEPWHLRYIGPKDATEMKKQGITTLEEYVGRKGTLE